MDNKISLDKFCDILVKINLDFTDYILEDWESEETGNTKLEGLTEKEWLNLYINYIISSAARFNISTLLESGNGDN